MLQPQAWLLTMINSNYNLVLLFQTMSIAYAKHDFTTIDEWKTHGVQEGVETFSFFFFEKWTRRPNSNSIE